MKHQTGAILLYDLKPHTWSRMNNENLRELARTVFATFFMVITVCFCFHVVATVPEPDIPEPVALIEDGAYTVFHPASAPFQSHP